MAVFKAYQRRSGRGLRGKAVARICNFLEVPHSGYSLRTPCANQAAANCGYTTSLLLVYVRIRSKQNFPRGFDVGHYCA